MQPQLSLSATTYLTLQFGQPQRRSDVGSFSWRFPLNTVYIISDFHHKGQLHCAFLEWELWTNCNSRWERRNCLISTHSLHRSYRLQLLVLLLDLHDAHGEFLLFARPEGCFVSGSFYGSFLGLLLSERLRFVAQDSIRLRSARLVGTTGAQVCKEDESHWHVLPLN